MKELYLFSFDHAPGPLNLALKQLQGGEKRLKMNTAMQKNK